MKIHTVITSIIGLFFVMVFYSCKKDSTVAPDPCNPTNKGTLFTNTRTIIRSKCNGADCHMNGRVQLGVNFDCDTSIVHHYVDIAAEINTDGMPVDAAGTPVPLSAADKAAINNWIAAGARITD